MFLSVFLSVFLGVFLGSVGFEIGEQHVAAGARIIRASIPSPTPRTEETNWPAKGLCRSVPIRMERPCFCSSLI